MNPVVFITGSARGIGRAAALCFAKKGYAVVINGLHDRDRLLAVKKEIENFHVPCLALTGDVGDPIQTGRMFAEIEESFGTVNILINNAAISYLGLLTDMSVQQWQDMMNVNLSSLFYCCREAIPAMVRNKKGRILNISSVWGITGASCETAYSAAKGGVNSFTRALAKELAPSNIQVNAIAFGAIDTEMNQCLSKEERRSLIDGIPAGRFASAGEAADFIYEIAVNAGDYLTGQIISFDGGWI